MILEIVKIPICLPFQQSCSVDIKYKNTEKNRIRYKNSNRPIYRQPKHYQRDTKLQSTLNEIKRAMIRDGNNISFVYMDQACGIRSTVSDGVFHFTSWFGDSVKEYSDINDALSDDFFGGESVAVLVVKSDISVTFC